MPGQTKRPLVPSELPWRRKRRPALSAARRRRIEARVEASRPWWRQVHPARFALAFGTTLVLSALFCIHLLPNQMALRLGEIAGQDVVAQRAVTYVDTMETRRRQEEAASRVPPQYDFRPQAAGIASDFVRDVFDAFDRAAEAASTDAPAGARPEIRDAVDDIRSSLGIRIQPETVALYISQTPRVREEMRRVARLIVNRAMSSLITDEPGELQKARDALRRDPALSGLAPRLRSIVVSIASDALMPTHFRNEGRTRKEREAARSSVTPQTLLLSPGDIVVRRGERVTQQHLDKLSALDPRFDAVAVAAISLMVVLMVGLVVQYVRLFHPTLYRDTHRLLLLSILSMLSVLGLKIGSALLGLPFPGVYFGYLGMMCVASSGMAIALLLSPRVATLIVSLLTVVAGLILNHELRFTVVTLGSSVVGIVSIATLRNRGDLVRAMAMLCGANALLVLLVGQIQGDAPRALAMGALWGVVAGLFALVLFWLGVAIFEKPFGITTHLRLLELSDPATPILQEFRMRVPGTYAHSLMVSNLAHAAAEAIGADALLVRVAAYYHDLGKMNRPEFFIENQANAENIHDRLSPSMSALILTSHVKEGLEMAEHVGLPPQVKDVIQQHHGTSLMKYFYHRATGGVPDPTLEAQFRYAGPKPQTKEAAILMLADSVEAASRCLERPTPSRIADFIAKMVDDKMADGQLDDCDLTLRDLKKIQDVFARTLSGTLHARIEYPGSGRSSTSNRPAPAPAPVPAAAPPPLPGGLRIVGGESPGGDPAPIDRKETDPLDGDDGTDSEGDTGAVAHAGAGSGPETAQRGG